jgi:hypothetical protein
MKSFNLKSILILSSLLIGPKIYSQSACSNYNLISPDSSGNIQINNAIINGISIGSPQQSSLGCYSGLILELSSVDGGTCKKLMISYVEAGVWSPSFNANNPNYNLEALNAHAVCLNRVESIVKTLNLAFLLKKKVDFVITSTSKLYSFKIHN